MELNLDNLVNEIVNQESVYRSLMMDAKKVFGSDSKEFHLWNQKWSAFYNLAREFGFEDKLIR